MKRAIFLFAVACGGGGHTPQSFAVLVHGMKFDPPELHAHPGDTITFENGDIVPHTVTAAGGQFDGYVDAGATWVLKVPAAGRYPYACKLHPTMTAVLVVE